MLLSQFFSHQIARSLNPIERLWEHIKYELSWEHCATLDQLRQKLKQVLDSISSQALAKLLRRRLASICGWDYITRTYATGTLRSPISSTFVLQAKFSEIRLFYNC